MDQPDGQESTQGQKDGAAEPVSDTMAVDDAVAQNDDAAVAQSSPHGDTTPESGDDGSGSARVERIEVTAGEDYIPQV